jgi:hypothetical protein
MPMRQLRTCEFCGADAAGVYEVLPPELSPTEAEQRRIVLCSGCAETLESVIDPLLERLGVDADGGASATDADGGADGSSAVGDDDGSVAAASSAADEASEPPEGKVRSDDGSPHTTPPGDDYDLGPDDAGRPPSEPGRDGVPGIDPEGDADPSAAGTEADAATGGTAVDADDLAAEGPDDSIGDATDGVTADDPGDSTADDTEGSATDDDGVAGTDAPGSPGEEPEEFRTVMRLLGNREFPVERGAIVELAASAYDLDDVHVHRIIDHAVDRGVIVDDGGTLRRN